MVIKFGIHLIIFDGAAVQLSLRHHTAPIRSVEANTAAKGCCRVVLDHAVIHNELTASADKYAAANPISFALRAVAGNVAGNVAAVHRESSH